MKRWRIIPGLGLVLTGVFACSDLLSGIPIQWAALIPLGQACALLWVLVAPFAWKLSERFPLFESESPRGPWKLPHALLHLLAALSFAAGMSALFSPVVRWTYDAIYPIERTWREALAVTANYFFFPKVLFYWLVVAAQHAFQISARLQAESLRATRTEQQLVRSRLDVLRMQMNPHFLFNALNSISALIGAREAQRASQVVARLGDALRASLDEEQVTSTSLEIELAHVENYLEIERCRFGDRLHFEVEVPDELLGAEVPRWILQPLVENAVTHGLEADARAGWIRLSARQDSQGLSIWLEDDGPGPSETPRDGIGLGNTRERLETLFGTRASVELLPREAGGSRVELRLPLASGPPEAMDRSPAPPERSDDPMTLEAGSP